jgi:hypothetical protein
MCMQLLKSVSDTSDVHCCTVVSPYCVPCNMRWRDTFLLGLLLYIFYIGVCESLCVCVCTHTHKPHYIDSIKSSRRAECRLFQRTLDNLSLSLSISHLSLSLPPFFFLPPIFLSLPLCSLSLAFFVLLLY